MAERVPEDQGPPREPLEDWVRDTMEEIIVEAKRHFPRELLVRVFLFCAQRHINDEMSTSLLFIRLLQRALFQHYRNGCPGVELRRNPHRRSEGMQE
ncbi:VPR protein [Simian immunodeficiency virus - olc]|uniref:Protein Vpr n=1 Tax=Simian immunodeficiency virus - olc TaxID=538563 RepID=B7UES3_SIV|nr:VPR protein [Simian immunodeficiency virus - olc]